MSTDKDSVKFFKLGEFMQQFRLENKMTQAEFGALSKVPTNSQFVSNWERGLCAPPLAFVHDLAKKMKKFDKAKFCELYGEDYGYYYAEKARMALK